MVPKLQLQREIHIPSHCAELELEFPTRDALLTFLRRKQLNLGTLANQLIAEAEKNVGARATLPVNRKDPLRSYEIGVTCKPVNGYNSYLKAINIGGNHLIEGLGREEEVKAYLKRASYSK